MKEIIKVTCYANGDIILTYEDGEIEVIRK